MQIRPNRSRPLPDNSKQSPVSKDDHYKWYQDAYDGYEPNFSTIEKIAESLNDAKIKLIMGTWCEDSQTHVPALMKILEVSGYDNSNLEIIAVNRDKNEPQSLLEGLSVDLVPTIILYKEDKELGRITENPANATLEEDLADILAKE